MKSYIYRILFILFLVPFRVAGADVLVLVHGWASDAGTWDRSGIVPFLVSRGWHDAGTFTATPGGVQWLPAPGASLPGDHLYRVNLPATAPIAVQAAMLRPALAAARQRHPGERIVLVGHSAGGVVARMAIVGPGAPAVDQLITIAAPNLGTARALEGIDIVESKPFFCPGPGIDFLKTVLGGPEYRYLKHSRPVLADLAPAGLGNVLSWLNAQPHPDIRYDAVVRASPAGPGDELVPGFSQDLNQVPVLRGRARVHVTPAAHGLNPSDGVLIEQLVREAALQGN